MNKLEIIARLQDVRHELSEAKDKLNDLVSQPIWSEEVYPELDNTVGVLQELNNTISDLTAIQKNVLVKPKE